MSAIPGDPAAVPPDRAAARSYVRARRGARTASEDGRILLLTLAFVLFAVALTGMVTSASAVHLDRKRLAGLADLLAADAAQAVSERQLYAGRASRDPRPGAGFLVLEDDGVAAAVERYLAEHPAVVPEGLSVTEATAPDGRSARVSLAAPSRPPLLAWFTDVTAPITVEATAVARAW